MSDLAARIATIRILSGLSQREMSELAGLSDAHVRLLETGARKSPSLDTISKIAETFNISLDWLAHGVGNPPSAEHVLEAVETHGGRSSRPAPTRGGSNQ